MRLSDYLKIEGITFVGQSNDFYHRLIYWPDWVDKELCQFTEQVVDMASTKKPFKATDTFKIQAGYPHEVDSEHKEILLERGIKRDSLSEGKKVCIPKLNLQGFMRLLSSKTKNPIVFSTPSDSLYLRDITIVDTESHENLSFVYVVNRKAQVITSWSELKKGGKHRLQLPKNIFKVMSYVTE